MSWGWLNREYVPHIAAYARAVIGHGYEPRRSSFSLYRSYSRDVITKQQGASYETDAEFYDTDGNVFLHVEAKASGRKPTSSHGRSATTELSHMPIAAAKEIEYVLDLAPQYQWIVGPGSGSSVPDPSIRLDISLRSPSRENMASFRAVDGIPEPL